MAYDWICFIMESSPLALVGERLSLRPMVSMKWKSELRISSGVRSL